MRLFFFSLLILLFSCKGRERMPDLSYLKMPDPTARYVPDSLAHLIPVLDCVLLRDQQYRYLPPSTGRKERKEWLAVFNRHAKEVDSLDRYNLFIVDTIIQKHGWLGIRDVGMKGAQAIFMTVQHAHLKTQESYLPLLRNALERKKVLPSQYAMLADRIEIKNRRPQKYGSQVDVGKQVILLPLLDPDSVDVWRKRIGMLESMAAYLKQWGAEWNPEQYKKELPALDKKYKIQRNAAPAVLPKAD